MIGRDINWNRFFLYYLKSFQKAFFILSLNCMCVVRFDLILITRVEIHINWSVSKRHFIHILLLQVRIQGTAQEFPILVLYIIIDCFRNCMWCLLVRSGLRSQEMKAILLFTVCLLKSIPLTSCECHAVNKHFYLTVQFKAWAMKEHFKARIEFCYAKRKRRPDSSIVEQCVKDDLLKPHIWLLSLLENSLDSSLELDLTSMKQ